MRNESIYNNKYYFHNKYARRLFRLIDLVGYSISSRNKKLRVLPTKDNIRKILLCRNDHMGDVLMVTPVIEALKKYLPETNIHMLISSSSKQWVSYVHGIDKYHYFDHFYLNRASKSLPRKVLMMARQCPGLIRRLRSEKYDIAIDFRPYFGNLIPILYLSNIKYLIGYDTSGFGFMLDKTVVFNSRKHFIQNMFDCIDCIQNGLNSYDYKMKINYDPEFTCMTNEFMRKYGITDYNGYLAVHPFSGNSCKMWDLSKWAELINTIGKSCDINIIVLGTTQDSVIDSKIKRMIKVKTVNMVGRTDFNQLVGIIGNCKLFIGADSLSAHIAAALSRKMIVISTGIQDDVLWKPWMSECCVLSKRTDCSPCYRESGCSHMRCIKDVDVASVYSEVAKYLQ